MVVFFPGRCQPKIKNHNQDWKKQIKSDAPKFKSIGIQAFISVEQFLMNNQRDQKEKTKEKPDRGIGIGVKCRQSKEECGKTDPERGLVCGITIFM